MSVTRLDAKGNCPALLRPAAFFIFLAGPAGAGLVAADFFDPDGIALQVGFTVHINPPAVFPAET